jgi:Spy/CpxP family protein refolding chaperone
MEGAQKRKARMGAQKAEREAIREEMKKQDEQIKEILTEEQRKKWQELKLEMRDRGPRGPRGGEIHDREEFRKRRGGNH